MYYIQTFLVNSTAVNNSGSCYLSGIDLFFQNKPTRINNLSGINSPGVKIWLTTTTNGVPDTKNILEDSMVRMNFDQVTAISDASVATTFTFEHPILVSTDKFYAVIIQPEDEDYGPWTNIYGDAVVGTNQGSSGIGGNLEGSFFQTASLNNNIKSSNDRSLKLTVYAAQFMTTSGNYEIVNEDYEFITIQPISGYFQGGETVYQDFTSANTPTTFYIPGTIVSSSSNLTISGSNTDFTKLSSGDKIILTDGTLNNSAIVSVVYVTNSSSLTVNTFPISLNNGYIKKTALANVYYYDSVNYELILNHSTSNSTITFNTTGIRDINVTNSGNSYNNNDIFTFYGGSVNAIANPVTSSTGSILGFNFTNPGSFNSTSGISMNVSNSSGGSSTGSGANVTILSLGGLITSLYTKIQAPISSIHGHRVDGFRPSMNYSLPSSTDVAITDVFVSNTLNNYSANLNNSALTNQSNINFITQYNAVILSRSQELQNVSNVFFDGLDYKSAVLTANISTSLSANSLYVSPMIHKEDLNFYVYNNQISNVSNGEENPTSGSALSRHISTKLTISNTAEDVLLYVNAWQPLGTQILAYAKIWNALDQEGFDDKFWSPLSAIESYSSSANTNDIVTLGFELPPYPAVNAIGTGYMSVNSTSLSIAGIGTKFTTELTPGQLIRIYDPNFPNTNFIMASVNTISSDIALTLSSNPGTLNGTFKFNTCKYDQVAFLNPQNDNVCRYYTSTHTPVDGYQTFAIKLVFTSNSNISPWVKSISALAVSA